MVGFSHGENTGTHSILGGDGKLHSQEGLRQKGRGE